MYIICKLFYTYCGHSILELSRRDTAVQMLPSFHIQNVCERVTSLENVSIFWIFEPQMTCRWRHLCKSKHTLSEKEKSRNQVRNRANEFQALILFNNTENKCGFRQRAPWCVNVSTRLECRHYKINVKIFGQSVKTSLCSDILSHPKLISRFVNL